MRLGRARGSLRAFHHARPDGGIGQAKTTTKSNEIIAIPLVLARLELTGAILTIDAIGTQTTIAETILHHGGDYLLALKANRPATRADVATFFEAPPAELIHSVHETIDADHGRLEQRRHLVCHDVDWLFSDRRYTDEPLSPNLAMIAMVETRTECSGRIEQERRFYLSSAKLDAKAFAAAVRSHWGIENRLHWVLDVVFHDDPAQLRTGSGPHNMTVIKHMAMNMIRNADNKHSLNVRRKKAALNTDYLGSLLFKPQQ